jgi:hypothetical protein
MAEDRAHNANRRPTAAEERDELHSKMISKYSQDAIDSNAEYQTRHAEELAAFEKEQNG